MKYLSLILTLFLTACNGYSDDDSLLATKAQLPPNLSTQVAAQQALILSLQNRLDMDEAALNKLQLVGKVHGVTPASSRRELAIGTDFGPCQDMGVLVGRGGDKLTNPLASVLESFQQCTGYSYTVSALDGSIQAPTYIAWDGPNCTGNILIETDVSGNGFNPQVTISGVVFSNPLDGLIYMVQAGQTPEFRMIQSSININGGGICNSDIESRMTVTTILNDSKISGVPSNNVSTPFGLNSP